MADNVFHVSIKNEQYQINEEELAALDIIETGKQAFHVLNNNKSYSITVLGVDLEAQVVKLSVNGEKFEVAIQNKFDRLVEQLGLSAEVATHLDELEAPMPGMVIKVFVTPGSEVAEGDPLIILEAMKMENTLKSPGSGIIKAIEVVEGQAVDKGQVLIKFE